MTLRVLSRDDIRRVASMESTIAIVKQAFTQLSAGDADVPIRTQLEVTQHEGIALFMPAYLRRSHQLGMKIVSVFPRNRDAEIPTIHAIVALLDACSGQPKALMDGTYLTALRTGAASGAATELLARPDSHVCAVFGAGVQGRTQLEAVCQVCNIEKAWVYDTVVDAAASFVDEMSASGGRIPEQIVAASSPAEALREADVVCTATTSPDPVLDDADVGTGTHINAVGAFTPDTREIPGETIQRARVFVDSRDAAWAEAGDLIIPREQGIITDSDVLGELGELVSGAAVGRTHESDVTFFRSVGNAVQDIAVAEQILLDATRLGIGHEIEL